MATAHVSRAKQIFAWAVLLIAVAANIAGYFFNLYTQFAWFDEVLHAFTLFALTLVLTLSLPRDILDAAARHAVVLTFVVASIGLALGAIWEIAEWGYDQMLTEGSTIKQKKDTIIDLIVDAAGALLAGAIAVSMVKVYPRSKS